MPLEQPAGKQAVSNPVLISLTRSIGGRAGARTLAPPTLAAPSAAGRVELAAAAASRISASGWRPSPRPRSLPPLTCDLDLNLDPYRAARRSSSSGRSCCSPGFSWLATAAAPPLPVGWLLRILHPVTLHKTEDTCFFFLFLYSQMDLVLRAEYVDAYSN